MDLVQIYILLRFLSFNHREDTPNNKPTNGIRYNKTHLINK